MNRSKETSPVRDGAHNNKKQQNESAESVEIELDTKQLRALDPVSTATERSLDDDAPLSRDLIDTATNLELSQSLEDLRNLSWPGLKPPSRKKPDK